MVLKPKQLKKISNNELKKTNKLLKTLINNSASMLLLKKSPLISSKSG